jgi:hypothetical protein
MRIVAWCTWKNPKGFDFVGLADDTGKIFVCEAFYLAFRGFAAFCRGTVVSLEFVNDAIGLAAVTTDGRCFVVPVPPPDTVPCVFQ